MATKTVSLQAASMQELENTVSGYIAQGFSLANRTPTTVTLIKRKHFSVFWGVIGFLFCVLPLLIYLIVYSFENDQMVIITLAGAPAAGMYGGPSM